MAATFARRFRPGYEIVDMVEDIACVAAEGGAFAAPSHPLEHARGQAEIVAGLGGVEEGIAAARAFGARDVVVAQRELRSGRRTASWCGGLRLTTAAAAVSDSPDATPTHPGRSARSAKPVQALLVLRDRREERFVDGRNVGPEGYKFTERGSTHAS